MVNDQTLIWKPSAHRLTKHQVSRAPDPPPPDGRATKEEAPERPAPPGLPLIDSPLAVEGWEGGELARVFVCPPSLSLPRRKGVHARLRRAMWGRDTSGTAVPQAEFIPAEIERMTQSEIDAVRALLTAKPRPVGWAERRARLDEVGSVWPVAGDVTFEAVDLDGVPGEWSIVPGSDASRVLMFFHGGGYCSGSILSHRRMVTEAGRAAGARTLAVGYRLAPEHPFPAAIDDALGCVALPQVAGNRRRADRRRRRQRGRRADAGADHVAARRQARSCPAAPGWCRPGLT